MSLIHQALKKLDTGAAKPPGPDSSKGGGAGAGGKRKKVLFVLMLASILFFAAVYTMQYITKTGSAGLGNARPVSTAQQGRAAGQRPGVVSGAVTEPLATTVKSAERSAREAAALFRRGRYKEAVELYSLLLEKSPDNPVLHNNIGLAYFRSGRVEDARKHLTRALSLRKGYAEAMNNYAAVLESEGKPEEAMELYGKAVELKPGLASARLNRAVAYEKRGKYLDARREYKKYLSTGAVKERAAVVKRLKELRATE